MVQSKNYYIVICDKCEIQYEFSSPYSDSEEAWDAPNRALMNAKEFGNWKEIDGKIYCDLCWHWDDDYENPILNEISLRT